MVFPVTAKMPHPGCFCSDFFAACNSTTHLKSDFLRYHQKSFKKVFLFFCKHGACQIQPNPLPLARSGLVRSSAGPDQELK